MIAASARLQAYLASRPGEIIAPSCFTLTHRNGNVYRWTDADVPVTIYDETDDSSGVLGLGVLGAFDLGDTTGLTPRVFAADSVRISGLRYRRAVGLDVDEQQITVTAQPPVMFQPADSGIDSGVLGTGELGHMVLGTGLPTEPSWADTPELLEGVPFMQAVILRELDGARLTWERAFLPAWNAPAIGAAIMFHGLVSTVVSVGATTAEIKVKSDPVLLAIDFPRNLYQPGCQLQLYGAECGVDRTAHQVAATAAGGTKNSVNWAHTDAGNLYALGSLLWTSGRNAGVISGVRFSWAGGLGLSRPLAHPAAGGDAFTLYPGCDHTTGAAGCPRFYGTDPADWRLRGFPFVPPPSTAL